MNSLLDISAAKAWPGACFQARWFCIARAIPQRAQNAPPRWIGNGMKRAIE
jgi:hypothetical protein